MRIIIVLCSLAVTCADQLPIDYLPAEQTDNGLSIGTGADAAGSAGDAGLTSYSARAELEKEFYTFSAPEDEFRDAAATQQALGSVKQGLRVVFIKAPENTGFEQAALALAKQAAQQQTAIYVLNKQSDIGELANKLNAASKNANGKPEVHFVKYRTAADAANAQKAIQSQYDSLGGRSQSINGGIAPVINFASKAAAAVATASRSPIAQQPQTAYLPSSILRFRY